jgi:pyruvate dehydrogenase (quinone)
MHCDTLLLLGCDFAWRQFYPERARIVQVDIEPTHLGRRHPAGSPYTGLRNAIITHPTIAE